MKQQSSPASGREIMTALFARRSAVALCCCVLTLMLAFYGIISGVLRMVPFFEDGFYAFIYFTMISNTLAALAMAFVLPSAVEGVRMKRFIVPPWVAVMHHLAATSIAIVTVFVLTFASWSYPELAFGGSGVVNHICSPILILIAFFCTENGYIYTLRDKAFGSVPFWTYGVVYFIEVVLVGEQNGGWPDIYHVVEYFHPAVALPMLFVYGFLVSCAVASLSNWFTRRRRKAMYACWTDGLDPVEVKTEAYGLGRMTGRTGEKNCIRVPLDILETLAEKYDLEPDDLLRPFMTGMKVGIREREPED